MAFYNRRQFISRTTVGFAGAGLALKGLGASNAFAANTSGYKAIVGIMLKGGMDNNDTILPKDSGSYNALVRHREDLFDAYDANSSGSSRNRDNILSLNPDNAADFQGRRFGLPRELTSVRDMFNAGEAAIVGNVGPLLEPVDRVDFEAGRAELPKRIFSHNDQQSTWMALDTEGVREGWGGRFADCVIASDQTANPLYTAVTASSSDVFLAGRNASPFRIPSANSSLEVNATAIRSYLGREDSSDDARAKLDAFLQAEALDHTNLFRRDAVQANAKGIANQIDYSERAAAATPLATSFPDTGLGRQMQSIAQSIALRGAFNVSRQVFYASMGNHDSHANQAFDVPRNHFQIDGAVAAFRQAMIELGEWNNVLVFTMSDFGRSMISNGSGTDHGWGGHHFVMGGSVAGRRIYGDIPSPDLGDLQYTENRGRLIPTTSVEQYAASIGSWFGLDASEIDRVFPNLARFDRSALTFV